MKRIAFDRASIIAWVTWIGYALACAWPAWTCPAWCYPAACLGYGMLARRWGSAFCAGAAGACAAAPLFRVAVDDFGLAVAGTGYLLAALGAVCALGVRAPVDAWGQMQARDAATLLWLATTAAGVWGLALADAVAFAASLC